METQTVNVGFEGLGEYLLGLGPSFVSLWFVAAVFLLAFVYYCIPKAYRWYMLLVASLLFLGWAGWQALVAALAVGLTSWVAGKCIASIEGKQRKKRRLALGVASAILIGLLAFSKLNQQFSWTTFWLLPLGISYYTFSVISYMADVYRGRQKPEPNPLKYLLFVTWFPKILQGPIERYGKLGPQLVEGHRFDWVGFCHGMQLALWGYMKKIIIADRIAPIVALTLGGNADIGGCATAFFLFLAAFQLYCDFSGCMDIAGGVSQMFGIQLEANFKQPFFSRSAAEFWRRWHITLGAWFKDYVYMPLTVSHPVMVVAKWARTHIGRMASRRVMQVIPLAVVWLLTGLWHGTGVDYLLWGAYWGALIIGSLLLEKPLAFVAKLLRINTNAPSWHVFQMARTFACFCLGRLITIPGNLLVSWQLFTKLFVDARPWELFDGRLEAMGVADGSARILTLGILVVVVVDILHERGYQLRLSIDGWNMVFRHAFYIIAILCICVFGAYGTGYDASSFIYAAY